MRSIEKEDNENDSEMFYQLQSVFPCFLFDLSTQLSQSDKHDSHDSIKTRADNETFSKQKNKQYRDKLNNIN